MTEPTPRSPATSARACTCSTSCRRSPIRLRRRGRCGPPSSKRGLTVVTAIASGRVARHIVEYAQRNAIDLIVIGTHGRTGVSHALLGSVAEAVTRRARCRVLTVPASLTEAAPPAATGEAVDAPTTCRVCGAETPDELICEACRAKIRGEALERKLRTERAGR
jgi:Universal stress protein family